MTDYRKICFIYCANNETLVRQSLETVYKMVLPENYVIEHRVMPHARCMTKGYNDAMKSSNAKYKVYLHQDLFLVNPFFIMESLNLFVHNPTLGLLGVAGAKIIPANCVWIESPKAYGKLLWGDPERLEMLSWKEVHDSFKPVLVVDGILMFTQYDLPWREDLFQGWHFYDLSQSLEFVKAGFQVGIPRQNTPWCFHKGHNISVAGFDRERMIFLKEYAPFIAR